MFLYPSTELIDLLFDFAGDFGVSTLDLESRDHFSVVCCLASSHTLSAALLERCKKRRGQIIPVKGKEWKGNRERKEGAHVCDVKKLRIHFLGFHRPQSSVE